MSKKGSYADDYKSPYSGGRDPISNKASMEKRTTKNHKTPDYNS